MTNALFVGGPWDGQWRVLDPAAQQFRVSVGPSVVGALYADPIRIEYASVTYTKVTMYGGFVCYVVESRQERHPLEQLCRLLVEGYRVPKCVEPE